jgi:hypothetical protein
VEVVLLLEKEVYTFALKKTTTICSSKTRQEPKLTPAVFG